MEERFQVEKSGEGGGEEIKSDGRINVPVIYLVSPENFKLKLEILNCQMRIRFKTEK